MPGQKGQQVADITPIRGDRVGGGTPLARQPIKPARPRGSGVAT